MELALISVRTCCAGVPPVVWRNAAVRIINLRAAGEEVVCDGGCRWRTAIVRMRWKVARIKGQTGLRDRTKSDTVSLPEDMPCLWHWQVSGRTGDFSTQTSTSMTVYV